MMKSLCQAGGCLGSVDCLRYVLNGALGSESILGVSEEGGIASEVAMVVEGSMVSSKLTSADVS